MAYKDLEREKAYKKAYNKAHYHAHKEYHQTLTKAWRAAHPEETKIYRKRCCLKKFYGLSMVEFNALLNNQRGACAICGRADWNGKGPHIDHDHITGKVRGLLCFKCNLGLAYLDYFKKYIKRTRNYLKGSDLILVKGK